MKKINNAINGMKIAGIVLAVMLAGGIPMIIVGASNEIYAVMGIGIAFTALGFYGTPTAWALYASALPLRRVVSAITQENLCSVQEIAAQLGMSEQQARGYIDQAFNKGYLIGYKRSGDMILLNDNLPQNKREKVAECPYCGAKFTYTSENARCPYCNSPVVK